MTRHSITAIIEKVQQLTIESLDVPYICSEMIRKAAVNEIIRLHAESKPLPKIDMKAESEKFLADVKMICEDYNDKITKP